MKTGFEIQCHNCGAFDLTDINGVYTHKHNCDNLNTNQLLLRIAKALENCHCSRCWEK
jgi:hypothetical protein